MHLFEANLLGALGTIIRDRTRDSLGGSSPSAAAVLSMLHFKPGLTTTELATVVGVAQPTVVRLIDGLERQGFVERGPPAGRVTPLTLTASGHSEAERMQTERLASLEQLLEALSADDRRRFGELIDQVVRGATTSREFARTTCRLCEHEVCGPEVCPIGERANELEALEKPQ